MFLDKGIKDIERGRDGRSYRDRQRERNWQRENRLT